MARRATITAVLIVTPSGPVKWVADDHPVVRSGITGMLEPDPGFDVVGEASSGLEAVALALSTSRLPLSA